MFVFQKNRDILDSPKNDPQSVALKGKKWAEITNEYNAHFPEKKVGKSIIINCIISMLKFYK